MHCHAHPWHSDHREDHGFYNNPWLH
jgi:hypothetical protein